MKTLLQRLVQYFRNFSKKENNPGINILLAMPCCLPRRFCAPAGGGCLWALACLLLFAFFPFTCAVAPAGPVSTRMARCLNSCRS